MRFTSAALQQLAAEAQVIHQRTTVPLVDANAKCNELRDILLELRQNICVVTVNRPKVDVERAWAAFVTSHYDLSAMNGLQFRALCIAETTALRPEFIAALQRNPGKLKRSPCLYGIVNAYFSGWRVMKNASAVEGLLGSVFYGYGGMNPVVETWRSSKTLFSDRAAGFLAEEICSERKSVDEVLKKYYVGPLTRLGLAVRAAAARLSVEYLKRNEPERDFVWSIQYLKWMIEDVLSELTLPDAFVEGITSLIMSDSAKRSEAFQRVLRSYVQTNKRLGDPRVREFQLNWRPVAPEAAQRYLSWLARETIIFFFNTILPNTSENRRRKDFWLRYHARIRDFQVAVSEADLWKIKASQKNSELLYYSHVAHPTTSAFLMRFEGYGEDYLVVEFSETGNAAYIFGLNAFEAHGTTMHTHRFELNRHLKFDGTHRIVHRGAWESKAAYKLATQFGISR